MVGRRINPLLLLTGRDAMASKISRKTGLWLPVSGGDRFLAALGRPLSAGSVLDLFILSPLCLQDKVSYKRWVGYVVVMG